MIITASLVYTMAQGMQVEPIQFVFAFLADWTIANSIGGEVYD